MKKKVGSILRALRDRGIRWSIKRTVFHIKNIQRSYQKKILLLSYGRYLRAGTFRVLNIHGKPSKRHTPVVICLWKRLDRIPHIIEQLDQQGEQKIDLFFWNNNYNEREKVLKLLGVCRPNNSIVSISLFNSRHNIGGIGRFYFIRKMLKIKVCGPYVIMLDDDENISNHFVRDLSKYASPKTYAAHWAFSLGKSYWHDRKVLKSREEANYCGTGGSIIDSMVFKDPFLFSKLPYKYWFIEDLWLSAYVKKLGWRLIKAETPVEFVDLPGNQSLAMASQKQEFYDYINENFTTLIESGDKS